jgi:hypothetical protein
MYTHNLVKGKWPIDQRVLPVHQRRKGTKKAPMFIGAFKYVKFNNLS